MNKNAKKKPKKKDREHLAMIERRKLKKKILDFKFGSKDKNKRSCPDFVAKWEEKTKFIADRVESALRYLNECGDEDIPDTSDLDRHDIDVEQSVSDDVPNVTSKNNRKLKKELEKKVKLVEKEYSKFMDQLGDSLGDQEQVLSTTNGASLALEYWEEIKDYLQNPRIFYPYNQKDIERVEEIENYLSTVKKEFEDAKGDKKGKKRSTQESSYEHPVLTLKDAELKYQQLDNVRDSLDEEADSTQDFLQDLISIELKIDSLKENYGQEEPPEQKMKEITQLLAEFEDLYKEIIHGPITATSGNKPPKLTLKTYTEKKYRIKHTEYYDDIYSRMEELKQRYTPADFKKIKKSGQN